jgi:N-acetylmuramoyl-L-alanine amidase
MIYTAGPGECVLSIARKLGFIRWQTIYDHPQNEDLKRRRPNPNVLLPGDRVFVPDKRVELVPRPTEQVHLFSLAPGGCLLRIVLEDEDGKPLAGKKFELAIGGIVQEGVTSGTGLVERPIAVNVGRAELSVWVDDGDPPYRFDLAIGHLRPVEADEGVRDRLSNLGYRYEEGDALPTAALAAFQRDAGVAETGEADQATRDLLKRRHDDVQ